MRKYNWLQRITKWAMDFDWFAKAPWQTYIDVFFKAMKKSPEFQTGEFPEEDSYGSQENNMGIFNLWLAEVPDELKTGVLA